jgi:hypothetical protein
MAVFQLAALHATGDRLPLPCSGSINQNVPTSLLLQRTPSVALSDRSRASHTALRDPSDHPVGPHLDGTSVASLPTRKSVPSNHGVTLRASENAGSCKHGKSPTTSRVATGHLCSKCPAKRKRLTMERPADSGRKHRRSTAVPHPSRAGRRHRTPVRSACECGHGSHQGSLGSWPAPRATDGQSAIWPHRCFA